MSNETEYDIVERLRALPCEIELNNRHLNTPEDGADEIERLRRENAELRKLADNIRAEAVEEAVEELIAWGLNDLVVKDRLHKYAQSLREDENATT